MAYDSLLLRGRQRNGRTDSRLYPFGGKKALDTNDPIVIDMDKIQDSDTRFRVRSDIGDILLWEPELGIDQTIDAIHVYCHMAKYMGLAKAPSV